MCEYYSGAKAGISLPSLPLVAHFFEGSSDDGAFFILGFR